MHDKSLVKASRSDSRFFCIGEKELLESDQIDLVDGSVLAGNEILLANFILCITHCLKGVVKVVKFEETSENQQPWNGLYTRWSTYSSEPKLQVCS